MKKGLLVVISALLFSTNVSAQRLEGFVDLGFSQGFSILAALQVSYQLDPNFTVGVRNELIFADGNGAINDNPKVEVQPYVEFNQGIYQDSNFTAGFSAVLRPYFRLFSGVQNGQYSLDFDVQTRIQLGINMGYRINPAVNSSFGFGFGTQFGIIPSPSSLILYNFLYTYFAVQYDLSSVAATGLNAIVGGGAAPGIDQNFNIGGFGFNLYGALEYNLTSQYGLRFQTGYSSGQSFGSWDTAEGKGFYVFIRAFLR